MRINSITNTPYTYKPAFASNTRIVRGKDGRLLYRNTTNFFRDDLNWKEFAAFIREKYKNAEKVNVFSYACSDGSEPMSLVILLKEIFGQTSQKFLPVIAKDIDKTVIYFAKSDFVNMDYMDYEVINRYTGGKFDKYFVYPRGGIGFEYEYPVRVNPELNNQIKYSIADINVDTHNITDKNTILFCRNFWPYIKSTEERVNLLHKLTGKLKDNCLLVTGNYDDTVELGKILSEEGFTRVKGLPHVYETN